MRFVIENTRCPNKPILHQNPKHRHSVRSWKWVKIDRMKCLQNYIYKVRRKSNKIHALLKNGALGGPRPHLRTRRAICKWNYLSYSTQDIWFLKIFKWTEFSNWAWFIERSGDHSTHLPHSTPDIWSRNFFGKIYQTDIIFNHTKLRLREIKVNKW